jgi:hypothetical protein
MRTRSLWLGVATLAALVALPALAAETPPPGPPAPAPELGQLSFFAGDWTCKGKTDASPFGPEHPTQAKVHISRELGGFWYVGHYEEAKTTENPHPFSFAMAMGYDSAAKALTLDGFDGFGNRSHEKSSGWQDGKLVFEGEMTGGGPPAQARDTFIKKGDAALEHFAEMQMEGKWVRLDLETCTKGK